MRFIIFSITNHIIFMQNPWRIIPKMIMHSPIFYFIFKGVFRNLSNIDDVAFSLTTAEAATIGVL